jgi:hypothetical protein
MKDAQTARTLANEEAILNIVEKDGTGVTELDHHP